MILKPFWAKRPHISYLKKIQMMKRITRVLFLICRRWNKIRDHLVTKTPRQEVLKMLSLFVTPEKCQESCMTKIIAPMIAGIVALK
jgi:hypothetical protein